MGAILAPANGRGAGRRLVEAGARELYLGFYDPAWDDAFGGAPLNRMSGFGPEANVLSFGEVLDEAARIRDAATDGALQGLYCVFNAMGYTARQEDFIARHYLPRLAAAGFTGVILSGTGLAFEAHACGLATVASTMCAVYNQDLAAWHAAHGIDRVILPRDLSLDDIEGIVRAVPGVSCEAFLMRNGCVFADSHCMGLHRAGRPSLCRTLRGADGWRQESAYVPRPADGWDGRRRDNHRTWAQRFHLNTCGLCALWRLERLGVDAYKIVGRGDNLDDLAADVALASRNLAIAQTCASEGEYLAAMERPAQIRGLCANEGLSCYYPEVMFGE